MAPSGLRLAALTLAALSLGGSWAHVLELGPRLAWPPELWIAATVRGNLYGEFGRTGAVVDLAAILALGALAFGARGAEGQGLRTAAAALYLAALGAWAGLVAPMNAVLADWAAAWTPGAVPADYWRVSRRWEFGHAVVALLKVAGFLALAASVPAPRRSASAA